MSPSSTPAQAFPAATVLGYPRVGPRLELKKALEASWAGREDAVWSCATTLSCERTQRMRELGLDAAAAVPQDLSLYDQVLDATLAVGALPDRFAPEREVLREAGGEPTPQALAAGFTVARGEGERAALALMKWFDSNYHYLVPEIGPHTRFEWLGATGVEHVRRDPRLRPVIVGPVTFLLLATAVSRPGQQDRDNAGFHPLDRLDDLLPVYERWLAELGAAGASWVQLDEPALCSDRWALPRQRVLDALRTAYGRLAAAPGAPALAVALTYGHAFDAVDALADTNVQAVALDLVRGRIPDAATLARWGRSWAGRTLAAGVVSGRNVWRTDLAAALQTLRALRQGLGRDVRVAVTSSTSLQHVPYDVDREDQIDPEIRSWLAFADQKIAEVVTLARGLAEGEDAIAEPLRECAAALANRRRHPGTERADVRARVAAVTPADRTRAPYPQRKAAQDAVLQLPLLPTTTIGSFPQTPKIRRTRAAFRRGELGADEYRQAMRGHIAQVVQLQERLGLDVLVHGEAERNDMVQYFAEHFDGFVSTQHGWVQSYGSRCTRPTILWGDVTRPAPITVEWSSYAASLTDRPVKGMLTGPVTIMAWSFIREDVDKAQVADQLALALRDEIGDLEAAGIPVIQVDEPAIRELLPLRKADEDAYLAWSVGSFRLATGGAGDATQIHTHLCYSDFATVISAIDRLDADVTSIEASRSKLVVLPAIRQHGFERQLGPGVWDIHSPRVPSVDEILALLRTAVGALDPAQVWVNPDCGLKTRRYPETEATLKNLVEAARIVRAELARG